MGSAYQHQNSRWFVWAGKRGFELRGNAGVLLLARSVRSLFYIVRS